MLFSGIYQSETASLSLPSQNIEFNIYEISLQSNDMDTEQISNAEDVTKFSSLA